MEREVRQYGLWDSPITPDMLARGNRLSGASWDSDAETLVWLEGRSALGVLVASASGLDAPVDVDTERSVRAQVGYGGGDFTVHDGVLYFVAHSGGCIYRQALSGGRARPITPQFGRAASPAVSPDGRWLAYVHSDQHGVDRIALVDTQGEHWPRILVEGSDFYMQPRWSPDGDRLAWISWDHPNMPWDGTLLNVAPIKQGDSFLPRLGEPRALAGGDDVAVCQAEFVPNSRRVVFVSDETGWGQIYVADLDDGERRQLTSEPAEHGFPAWGQDMRTLAVRADGAHVYAVRRRRGFEQVVRIDLATGEEQVVDELSDYTEVSHVAASPRDDKLALVVSAPRIPPRVIEYEAATGAVRVVARSSSESIPAEELAAPEAISWRTAGDEIAHGLLYMPAGSRYTGTGLPPLIVLIHGGPTSQAKARWDPTAQFLATRGYAVLHVNYRGSTGYGREYMLRLRSSWGVCDVEDAVSGVRHLADSGVIDGKRTVIMGGSAGGFTVLQTMIDEPEAFAAGICLYGVSNQFSLVADTHKFEERYSESLIGPLPEAAALYRERSPELHADRISRPLALFQGEDDRVVPRRQSDAIADALKCSGVPHVYHVYEGEGHGWRKRETIEHFWQEVDAFLRRYVVYS